jgi:pimeloyl-[acyl-carrier protein] methyl ester esterase
MRSIPSVDTEPRNPHMLHIVFFHGWAGCSTDWDPVITHLRAEMSGTPFSCECPDAGYWGPARAWSGQHPDGIVGYSLGCFDATVLARAHGCPWIAINGFTRFSRAPDFAEGVPPRLLTRMQAQLHKAPLVTVNTFRHRIGVPSLPPQSPCQPEALVHGLYRLLTEDHRPHRPQSALAGRLDPLVSQDHSQACFGEAMHLISGGHNLLTTHARDIAAFVKRDFL